MMLFTLITALQDPEPPVERTHAIYRLPTAEGESKFFPEFVHNYGFDTFCIEPKVGPSAMRIVKVEKVKTLAPAVIDTAANLKWRNVTINFLNGKLSPRAWLQATKNLKETVHFLSSPKTELLRDATGKESHRAVQAEVFLLTWPGLPCLTADDLGKTRYLPGPGALESWILAMGDYLGPQLYLRSRCPYLATGTPTIVRADTVPGLFVYRFVQGTHSITVFLNNGPKTLVLPPISVDHVTFNKGLDLEEKQPRLMSHGLAVENLSGE